MKKILKISIFLLLIIVLGACGDKKEYKLIELTSNDLLQNIMAEDNKDFVFAVVDDEDDNYETFLEHLQKVVQNAKINIYYIDYNHIDSGSGMYLLDLLELGIAPSTYYVFQDGNIKLSKKYSDYATLYNDLKNTSFLSEMIITDDNELLENLNKAREEYVKGNIGIALNYLNLAWSLEEAKEEYNNNAYYNLINTWEVYDFKDDELTYATYFNNIFILNYNYYLSSSASGLYAVLEKPTSFADYKNVYYYLKDDIIYTAEQEDGKYTKKFKINYISANFLRVTDLSNNKDYEYIRGD